VLAEHPTTYNVYPMTPESIVLGITGASGAPYAVRLLEVLLAAGRRVDLSISPAGQEVLRHELGVNVDLRQFDAAVLGVGAEAAARLRYHHYQDLMAPIASGSYLTAGMVICPCSGGTLSSVVHGASQNLIHRAAEVHLKERRPLVLVPRETPLSMVTLDNLRRAAEVGATVLPAMPGFYHQPRTIEDLVDFVVARICDQLKIEQQLTKRWGE
jgi:4-hydroxy-3-polyprenylbenzoate decarboxylase